MKTSIVIACICMTATFQVKSAFADFRSNNRKNYAIGNGSTQKSQSGSGQSTSRAAETAQGAVPAASKSSPNVTASGTRAAPFQRRYSPIGNPAPSSAVTPASTQPVVNPPVSAPNVSRNPSNVAPFQRRYSPIGDGKYVPRANNGNYQPPVPTVTPTPSTPSSAVSSAPSKTWNAAPFNRRYSPIGDGKYIPTSRSSGSASVSSPIVAPAANPIPTAAASPTRATSPAKGWNAAPFQQRYSPIGSNNKK